MIAFRSSPRSLALLPLGLLGLLPLPLRAADAPAPAAEETFSESVQVSVVNLDVYVTDKQGKPMTGLRKEDFIVLEDGKPVEVSNFFAENGRAGVAASAPATGTPAATAASQGPVDQRLRLVVFVDDVNLSAANRSRILQSVGTFLHTELKPGDQVMLVRYDEKLVVRRSFTADLGQVDADLKAILALPTDIRKYNLSLTQALSEVYTSVNGGESFGPLAEASISNWAAQGGSMVRGALNALDSTVSSLAGVPGRKAILYVSDGLPLVPGLDMFTIFTRAMTSARTDKRTPEMVAERFDLTKRFRRLTSHASRNRITFYPIEAYGTRGGEKSLFDTVSVVNRQNGLRFLAEDTGGRAMFNAANVPEALARMEQDLTTYYSLGYQPQRAGDTAEHKIEVRVKDRNVAEVRYRQWYRDKPVSEAVAERTLAAMHFAEEDNPLGASVEVVAGKKPGETLVRVKVPLAKVYLEPQGDSRQGHLRLYVVASGEGQTTSVRETRQATVNVPEAEAASGKMHDYTHEIAIPLPAGSYTLGLGVRDEKGAVTSYLHKDFAVAPRAADPGTVKRCSGDSSLPSPGAEADDRAWKSGWVSGIPAQPLHCPQGTPPPPGGRPMTSPRSQARPLAALALLLACSVPVSAGAAGAAGAPPAGETFSDSIQVSVVTLDVFVTDKRGKPITGLQKEDFTVLEDGAPVEVSNFFAENGRTAAIPAAAPAPGPPGVSAGPVAAAMPAAEGADQRLRLVVFVDDVSLSAANRSRILQSVGRFLHTELQPGDEVMLVRYDEKLDVRQPFTADLGRLDAGLAAMLTLPTDVRKYDFSFNQALEELRQALNGAEGFGPLAEGALSNWAAQESDTVRGALTALDSVITSLAGVPGRKAILYVSDGLPLVPGLDMFTVYTRAPEARAFGSGGHTPEMVAQRFDLTQRFRAMTSHASRNRILFYPIEAYGTREGENSLFDAVSLANRQNGLRILAEDTGGRELFNATNVPAALGRMAEDFSTYYSLGYQPRRPGDGLEHKIEVRVKPRGAQVRYRQWYRDKPVSEMVAERTLAAMRFGAEENPLGAAVDVVAGKKPGEVLVRVHVPLGKLYLEPQGDSRLGQLRLYMVVSGERQTTAVRETRLANVTVPEAEAAAGAKKDYLHEIAIPLSPGRYTLGLGVRDERGTSTSYLHRDFVVAAPAAQAAAKP